MFWQSGVDFFINDNIFEECAVKVNLSTAFSCRPLAVMLGSTNGFAGTHSFFLNSKVKVDTGAREQINAVLHVSLSDSVKRAVIGEQGFVDGVY